MIIPTQKIIISLLFVLSGVAALNAQVNTESLRRAVKSDTVYSTATLSYQIVKGNNDYLNFTGDLRTDWFNDDFYSFLVVSAEYKKLEEKSVIDKGFAHLRLSYNLSELFAPEIFIQKEYNNYILLKDRNLIGLAMRMNVHSLLQDPSKNSFELVLSSGIMAENELMNVRHDSSVNIVRSTNYFALNFRITDKTQMSNVVYYQPNLADFRNFRILIESKLVLNLSAYFSFVTTINYRFNNTPIYGINKYDIDILNGLSVSL